MLNKEWEEDRLVFNRSLLIEELPPHLKERLEKLKAFFAPHTHKVYLVGGVVRDLVMKRAVNDLDIEVFGVEERHFKKLMATLGAKGVGKAFFVYKWEGVDISLPRIEKKRGVGHRGFEVSVVQDPKEASLRRDFTMNALMLDIFTGELLDFWGGLEDIQNQVIRIIDEERFSEDSLRVLRGMQFAARFGFKIDATSAQLMQGIDLDDISQERIFWEFEKMFEGPFLHYGLYYLFCLGIAKKLLDLTATRAFFLKTARELIRMQRHFEEPLRSYYFLYIISKNLHIAMDRIALFIGAPNHYLRALKGQKAIPSYATDRFLVALSMKYPLKKWLGCADPALRERARALGVYEKSFDGGIRALDLIKEGLQGEQIARELRRRKLLAIRQTFKGKR